MKVFDAFKLASGAITSVTIYPSEFGKERIAKVYEWFIAYYAQFILILIGGFTRSANRNISRKNIVQLSQRRKCKWRGNRVWAWGGRGISAKSKRRRIWQQCSPKIPAWPIEVLLCCDRVWFRGNCQINLRKLWRNWIWT